MHILSLTTGMEQFLRLFGSVTVADVILVILAIVFLVAVYKKVHKFIIDKHEADKKRDEQLIEAVTGVRKYPEYRQKSLEIQNELKNELAAINSRFDEQNQRFDQQGAIIEDMMARLIAMEENDTRRERNKIRDRLLQGYRYYTDTERNPEQTWTRMEAEAFWDMFKDYEDAGGDGFMHSVVQPDMEKLTVVEMDVIHR